MGALKMVKQYQKNDGFDAPRLMIFFPFNDPMNLLLSVKDNSVLVVISYFILRPVNVCVFLSYFSLCTSSS